MNAAKSHETVRSVTDAGMAPPLTLGAAMRWSVVSKILPDTTGRTIEIGCGQGSVTWRLAKRASELTAIEPDAQSFAKATSRLGTGARVLNTDDTGLPASEQFDTLCAFEVLEHIEDDKAALKRWTARIRPGGRILISVPAHRQRLGPSDELVGHFRRYDRGELSVQLRQLGFENIREEMYGFPVGYALEEIRNAMARRMIARNAINAGVAERTAASGRFFQPDGPLAGFLFKGAGALAAAMQTPFPQRGPGLIVTAILKP